MIRQFNQVFICDTKNTTYCFRVLETGQLEHLYYGKKIALFSEEDAYALFEKHAFAPGNTNFYDNDHPNFSLEDMRLEFSSYGKGDIWEPFIEVIHEDGNASSDFVFESAKILDAKTSISNMPSSYDEEHKVEELVITLVDKNYDLAVDLHYAVFEERNVIAKRSVFHNNSDKSVRLTRFMSNQLDFEEDEYVFTSFHGAWANEMNKKDIALNAGKVINSSYTGTTSSRANSFVMLSKPETTEDYGKCYGFHLIYSGNHYECAEKTSYGKTRIVTGINPQSFDFLMNPSESFESPEALLAFSDAGFNGMSQILHSFVRNCIVRGEWKNKIRPVLLNSWEAAYFDINESKLLKLAKAGKEVGIELFVMDDGWFGERNDDKTSLGDWTVNKKKLPNGVDGLAKKINDLGLDFGIWVEPEMVNVNSKLYERHPEWVLEVPGVAHSEGRNQRILDLTNPEVLDFIIDSMSEVFSSANISYVKWDMNRIFSDYYSKYIPKDRQGEVAHRYVLGLYKVWSTLTEKFPHILFEGCSAGGNRFDLGTLCYFPQIWASDDTDAVYRVNAQTSYSYGYPMSVVSAHVSASPNHQTLRVTPLTTRFHVAAFGVCGYEVNLCDMSKEELAEIKEQIILYKEWRDVLQFGNFYRGRNGNIHEWTCVSPDKTKAVGMIMQELVTPNHSFEQFIAKGLDEEKRYSFSNRSLRYNIKNFGDLVNTASPVHVKPDSLLHNVIAKFVTMPGETESYISSGGVLMHSGVKLKQAFAATGYDENVRYFQDFASRMYFMEEWRQ